MVLAGVWRALPDVILALLNCFPDRDILIKILDENLFEC